MFIGSELFQTFCIVSSLSSEKDSGKIYVYDGRGNNVPLHTIGIHTKPITFMKVLFDPVQLHECMTIFELWCIEYINAGV